MKVWLIPVRLIVSSQCQVDLAEEFAEPSSQFVCACMP